MKFKLFKTFTKKFSNYNFCIIGSGPSGLFTAKGLMKKLQNIKIDIFEKLPHPFGLIRTGVAPDHQEVKNIQNEFNKVLKDERVNFYGNINVFDHLSLQQLKQYYSAIIFAYGADDEHHLDLENEDCFGSYSGRNFVNWYNGHVLYSNNNLLKNIDKSKIKNVVIVGHGNVAIDIARMLSKPVSELRQYDIPERILKELSEFNIQNIYLVGRRGLIQSSFTVKEVRELSDVGGVRMNVFESEMMESLREKYFKEIENLNLGMKKHAERKIKLFKGFNALRDLTLLSKEEGKKNIIVRFFWTPSQINITEDNRLKSVVFTKNEVVGDTIQGTITNTKQNEMFEVNDCILFKSIGYKSKPIIPELSFDNSQCVLRNDHGVLFNNELMHDYQLYTSGWVKRGAKGIIDSTLRDSQETISCMLNAIQEGLVKPTNQHLDIISLDNDIITKEGWFNIDESEIRQGVSLNKIREKILSIERMLEIGQFKNIINNK